MKKITLVTVVVALLATVTHAQRIRPQQTEVAPQNSVASSPVGMFIPSAKFYSWRPTNPVVYTGKLPVWGGTSATQEDALKLVANQEQLKHLLPDYSVEFYIKKYDESGAESWGLSGVTGQPGTYEVIYDIAQHTTIALGASDDLCQRFQKIGVGIRVRANIITRVPGIDVSNLSDLARSTSDQLAFGGLSYQVFGIEGRDVLSLSPTTNAQIDNSSVSAFMQSIGVLKARLFDSHVTIVPRVFAVQHNDCLVVEKNASLTSTN